MTQKGSVEDRLKARWAKTGGGPEMEEELKRREDLDRAKARGVAPTSKAVAASKPAGTVADAVEKIPAGTNPSLKPLSAQTGKRTVVQEETDSEDEAEPIKDPEPEPEPDDEVTELKKAGNEALAEGDLELAVELYTEALTPNGEPRQLESEVAAVLYNNRALARLRLEQWMSATTDASAAMSLRPEWPKPYFSLARAQCELGSYKQAVATCRKGETLALKAGDHSRPFEPLLDNITHIASLNGSIAGFDGRLLEVRCAGEDAWLCKPAPADPLLDTDYNGENDDDSHQLSILQYGDSGQLAKTGAPTGAERVEAANLAVAKLQEKERALAKGTAKLSFRSVRDAVEAARDGDRILLLRGIHNFSGQSVDIKKRILIKAEGDLREVMIDQRANNPTFRIYRTCMITNIEVDMSGFRECVLVEGNENVRPVVDHCMLRCSGDDAINVAGSAVPTFRDCELIGRKCGLKVLDNARGEFIDCKFNTCNQQGVRAHDQARCTLRRCHIEGNIEEGVVVMDNVPIKLSDAHMEIMRSQLSELLEKGIIEPSASPFGAAAFAHLEMIDCHIRDNKAVGVDVSDSGAVTMRNCWIKDNYGGLFMWDNARASLFNVRMNGGTSHALLGDCDSLVRMKNCKVEGVVQATDACWQGIQNGTNQVIEPEEPTQLPAEEGAFKFEADRYTRKQ